MTAKSAPYPPCTVTDFWLKYQDRDRMLRRVTLTEPYRRAVTEPYRRAVMGHASHYSTIRTRLKLNNP